MPWGKLDDKFHRNAKVRALRRMGARGREALGAWVYWWSWCLDDAELTGFVPADELPPADAKSAALLVDVGLWEQTEGGYVFHDFGEYNPSARDIEAKRRADRERVAAKRAASRTGVASDSPATIPRVASTRVPSPSPPDPIPSRPGESARDPESFAEDPDEQEARLERMDGDHPDDDLDHDAVLVAKLRTTYELVCHGGKETLRDYDVKRVLAPFLGPLRARRAADPVGLFREVVTRWRDGLAARGHAPKLDWFAKDFAQIVDGSPKAPEPPRRYPLAPVEPPVPLADEETTQTGLASVRAVLGRMSGRAAE